MTSSETKSVVYLLIGVVVKRIESITKDPLLSQLSAAAIVVAVFRLNPGIRTTKPARRRFKKVIPGLVLVSGLKCS